MRNAILVVVAVCGLAEGTAAQCELDEATERVVPVAPDGEVVLVDENDSYVAADAHLAVLAGGQPFGVSYLMDIASGEQLRTFSAEGGAVHRYPSDVSMSGDIVVIGYGDSAAYGFGAGTAFAFSVLTGAETAELAPPMHVERHRFGASVATDGQFIAVASDPDEVLGVPGSVFVFTAGGQLLHQLFAEPGDVGFFGQAMDIAGGVLAVGSFGLGYPGRVYLFDISTGAEIGQVSAPNASEFFGHELAIQDNEVFVADQFMNQVSVFALADGALVATITDPDNTYDYFGTSIAVSKSLLAVVARHMSHGEANSGLHLYDRRGYAHLARILHEWPIAGGEIA